MGYFAKNPVSGETPADEESSQVLRVSDIENQDEDRTLLYGKTLDRKHFHVFLKGGRIYRVIYDSYGIPIHPVNEVVAQKEWAVSELIPSGSACPESTEEEFAKILNGCGAILAFSPYNVDAAARREFAFGGFHGEHDF